jgi:uncharacterized Zn-binding protein involved in type VI secretion
MRHIAFAIAFVTIALPGIAAAQNQPAKIVTGNGGVIVGGQQAATAGDAGSDGAVVTDGSSNVFIGGKPAAVVGSATSCGGKVVTGSSNVFVNGKPLALAGSDTTGCPEN